MAHAIPELVYEMYQNSTIEEMIAATESVWDRYCNPIAFAMEADEGTDGETQKPGFGQRVMAGIKAVATFIYGIFDKIRRAGKDLMAAINRRFSPTNVYKSKVGYLTNFIDYSAEYVSTLNANGPEDLKDQATRNQFATKMEDIHNKFEDARKKFSQPTTDADKSSGVMNPRDTVNAAKKGLEKLDRSCTDALNAAKRLEKAAGNTDKDGLAAANFIKTHATKAAEMATSCLNAIKTVCGITRRETDAAQREGQKKVREMERNDAKRQREAAAAGRKAGKAASKEGPEAEPANA